MEAVGDLHRLARSGARDALAVSLVKRPARASTSSAEAKIPIKEIPRDIILLFRVTSVK
jgi:hypothetical protein